jgi:flagella basal body P-ring formation protein FlgA
MIARTAALATILLAATAARSAVVRLKESAQPSGAVLLLDDVADVLSNDDVERRRLGSIELGAAPEPGQSQWLDLSDLKDRLYRRGVRLDQIEFVGPRRVHLAPAPPGAHPPAAPTRSEAAWRAEIERLIASSAAGEWPDVAPNDLLVRVEAERAVAFLAEHPTTDWELLAPPSWKEGWQPLELLVHPRGDVLRFTMQTQISRRRRVVTACRDIRRGETIAENDVRLAALDSRLDADDFAFDPADVVGREAKRELQAEKPIARRDLRRPPVVFRGQPVNVRIRYRSAWIQKSFVAAADGGVGDWIAVFDPARKDARPHDYLVRVSAPHEAELPENAPLNAAAPRSAGRANERNSR